MFCSDELQLDLPEDEPVSSCISSIACQLAADNVSETALTLTCVATRDELQPDVHGDPAYCCVWGTDCQPVADVSEATAMAALKLTCVFEEFQPDLNISNPPDFCISIVDCQVAVDDVTECAASATLDLTCVTEEFQTDTHVVDSSVSDNIDARNKEIKCKTFYGKRRLPRIFKKL